MQTQARFQTVGSLAIFFVAPRIVGFCAAGVHPCAIPWSEAGQGFSLLEWFESIGSWKSGDLGETERRLGATCDRLGKAFPGFRGEGGSKIDHLLSSMSTTRYLIRGTAGPRKHSFSKVISRNTMSRMGALPFELGKYNVLVVGSGGVGTMAAYAMEKGGKASVTAVLRSNFEVVNDRGFAIDSRDHGAISGWKPTHIRETVPNVAQEAHLQPYDFIIVATKNVADIPPTVADIIAPAVTPKKTAIALLQNGLNIEKPIIASFPYNPVISGVPYIGAIESPHGTIKHINHDKLIISPFDNPNIPVSQSENAARLFLDAYSCRGVTCEYEPDVRKARWKKLLYNASYNTVAAILGMDTSRMRASEHVIDNLVRPVMKEIQQAAKVVAPGVELSDQLIEDLIRIDTFEGFFRPSMLQDIEKVRCIYMAALEIESFVTDKKWNRFQGKFIEFENIIGEPLREAESHGISMPTLKVIYALLKGIQWKMMEENGLVKVPMVSTPEMKYGEMER
ncbi:ketopantoate reductase PanE/ApbA-domain-containing protein [Podospora fimiseda]|uniref:Ketopantoate reductase PanE/ApbA-domain-containing protein n=1 Tax=Podospora fimiseda TaxID=252190 RepID=A0AAN7BZL2_9PEZI|nr:ketopantoate reductase PanE/ApbA-domain-containing protein [Podospora fimiseda]